MSAARLSQDPDDMSAKEAADAYDALFKSPRPEIEAIRTDEAVRDAFVECYTLQGIISENGMNVTPEMVAQWDRVESELIRAILMARVDRVGARLPEGPRCDCGREMTMSCPVCDKEVERE